MGWFKNAASAALIEVPKYSRWFASLTTLILPWATALMEEIAITNVRTNLSRKFFIRLNGDLRDHRAVYTANHLAPVRMRQPLSRRRKRHRDATPNPLSASGHSQHFGTSLGFRWSLLEQCVNRHFWQLHTLLPKLFILEAVRFIEKDISRDFIH